MQVGTGDPSLQEFDDWTLSIGNGVLDKVQIPKEMIAVEIIPNSKQNNMSESQAMKKFIETMFPDLETNIMDKNWLDGRAILCSTNKEVYMVNEMMSTMLPGVQISYASADELQNTDDLIRFNTEYLNSLLPNGFPPHRLLLKPGMPLMLLRNINPREGLCNGTNNNNNNCGFNITEK